MDVKNNRNVWRCQCDCGNFINVKSTNLLTKKTQSCGCFLSDRSSEVNKKYNTYDLSGNYGIGFTSNGYEFYFDIEDYNKIKDYCWWKNKDGYITAHDFNDKNYITIRLHKLIMDIYNMVGDHWDGNPVNNCKNNLRPTTSSQNAMNRKTNNNNSSGFKGVHWDKKSSQWRARIGIEGRRINLGLYNNIQDAINARIEAEQKYFGEYSILNRPKEKLYVSTE